MSATLGDTHPNVGHLGRQIYRWQLSEGAHRFSLEIAMGSKRLEHIRILFDQLPEMLDPIRDASADNGRNNPKEHES